MSKRVLIGLFALGVVAFLWTEANAGCAVIAGFQICADWITGGSAASVLTVEGPAGQVDTTSPACGVFTTQGPPETTLLLAPSTPAPPSPVDLRLFGTTATIASPQCGFDQSCDIEGVVFCAPPSTVATASSDSDDEDDLDHPRGRTANTMGPLAAHAPGFSQTDPFARKNAGRSYAAFGFHLSKSEQDRLCPTPTTFPAGTTGGFQTFVPRKGFFEACVTTPTTVPTTRCLREFCMVRIGGPNDVHVYGCRNIQTLAQ